MTSLLDSANWAKYAYVLIFKSSMPQGKQENYVIKDEKSGYLVLYRNNELYQVGGVQRIKSDSQVLSFPALDHAIKEKRSIIGIPIKITLENEEFHSVNAIVPLSLVCLLTLILLLIRLLQTKRTAYMKMILLVSSRKGV